MLPNFQLKNKNIHIYKRAPEYVCVLRISLFLSRSLTFAPQDKLICIDVTATGWAKKKTIHNVLGMGVDRQDKLSRQAH